LYLVHLVHCEVRGEQNSPLDRNNRVKMKCQGQTFRIKRMHRHDIYLPSINKATDG
jgi:hypothetical protein